MRYRKLDENGDYVFGAGANSFHTNSPEAVAQAVLTRLNLWVGEWFADTSDGTGWNQSILGKQSGNLYELTLRQRVLETPGVQSIEDFSGDLDTQTRKLTISIALNTIYGNAQLLEEELRA
ncbi:hypothetical protein [Acinetobacter sp. TSRC1-2]|uniref:hypothetical protein n=1 Tax=unclassified Acinetobacter TaxID=196816 RepID=UPI003CF1DD7A